MNRDHLVSFLLDTRGLLWKKAVSHEHSSCTADRYNRNTYTLYTIQTAYTIAQTTAIRIDDIVGLPYHGAEPLVGTRLPAVMLFAVRQTNLESAHRGDWSPTNVFLKTVIKIGEARRTQVS